MPRQSVSLSWSASLDRRREHIAVVPVVVSELKFIDVELEIFLADLVVRADDAALHDGPEALNGVGVNRTDDILASAVTHMTGGVRAPNVAIGGIVVRGQQAHAMGNGGIHEAIQRFRIRVF